MNYKQILYLLFPGLMALKSEEVHELISKDYPSKYRVSTIGVLNYQIPKMSVALNFRILKMLAVLNFHIPKFWLLYLLDV